MTEEEWFTSDDYREMVYHLHNTVPPVHLERKCRLMAVTMCQRVWDQLDLVDERHPIEAIEQYLDGILTSSDLNRVRLQVKSRQAEQQSRFDAQTQEVGRNIAFLELVKSGLILCSLDAHLCGRSADGEPRGAALNTLAWEINRYVYAKAGRLLDRELSVDERNAYWFAMRRENAKGLRDIVGNPFRPVAFDPAWRTSTAVALARQMYDSRDFAIMPILADALQDAGCDNDDILSHCRDPQGTHVRGCWVVDLVLGKS